ncbi:MAG: hypothetical protein JKY12_01710 [Sneathiella sp.]|nr:hypothetical protein [Sneathiella sp.]
MTQSQLKAQLTEDLIENEALRLKPYRDTVGKLTIGVGRNLDDRGISKEEAMYLLSNDIGLVLEELGQKVGCWSSLPNPQKIALADMCFNLGWPRLSKFKKMLTALGKGDFDLAATEALDSKWARQVGQRSERIATLLRS